MGLNVIRLSSMNALLKKIIPSVESNPNYVILIRIFLWQTERKRDDKIESVLDSQKPTKVLSFLCRSLIRGRPLLQPQSYAAVSFLRRPLLQPQSLGNKTPHHTVSPNATKKRKSHKESYIKGTDTFPFGTVTSRYVLAEVTQRLTSAKESSSKPALQSHEDLAKKLQQNTGVTADSSAEIAKAIS
ncbi:hypothetical protein JHK84_053032 [Glycine max]|nr:hypothetical protein JHK86_053005 [Glycine max]KAG5082994.1 hypothetical protein JHK84_053032 [Glycine max]